MPLLRASTRCQNSRSSGPGEGRRVLLGLVLEDRLDLEPELLLRERHQPGGLGDRPLLPRAAVQPYLGPPAARRHVLGERPIDGLLAHPVGTVRIGEVAGDEHQMRVDLRRSSATIAHVRRPDRALRTFPSDRRGDSGTARPRLEPEGADAGHRLGLADDPLGSCTSGMSTSPGRLAAREASTRRPRASIRC